MLVSVTVMYTLVVLKMFHMKCSAAPVVVVGRHAAAGYVGRVVSAGRQVRQNSLVVAAGGGTSEGVARHVEEVAQAGRQVKGDHLK